MESRRGRTKTHDREWAPILQDTCGALYKRA